MPLTIYRADWVIPVEGPPIPDGGVAVTEDGWVRAVGPWSSVRREPGAHDFVSLGRAAICPGLVNVHAHPDLTLFRGALEDLAFPRWIARLTRIHRSIEPADLATGAELGLLEMMRGGVTTFGATEQTGASIEPATRLGMRGTVYVETFGPDPGMAGASMAELRARVSRGRDLAGDRIRVGVSPHAPYTVSDTLYREVAALAEAEALPLAAHIAESREEGALVRGGAGPYAARLRARGVEVAARADSPVALLEALGVLDRAPLLIHCVHADAEDLRRIAAAGASIAHCPAANARLGHGIAPLQAMLDQGVRVGIGTDSAASNNRLDLLEEARLATLFHRAVVGDPEGIPARAAFELATLGGARALGMEGEIGSIRPGKRADLCVISLEAPHMRPVYDPYAAIVHGARASDVVLTLVQGEVIWDAKRPELPAELADRIDAGADRIRRVMLDDGAGP